jgi:hypothetical protein
VPGGLGLKAKRQSEENKLYASLMGWATFIILNTQTGRDDTNGSAKSTSSVPSTPIRSFQQSNTIPTDHKNLILRMKIKTFLKRACAAYGRTALCLSGGAMLGNYHFGAVRALLETGCYPTLFLGRVPGA